MRTLREYSKSAQVISHLEVDTQGAVCGMGVNEKEES